MKPHPHAAVIKARAAAPAPDDARKRFERWWRADPELGTFDPKANAWMAWQAAMKDQP